jgi:hypothetical protein
MSAINVQYRTIRTGSILSGIGCRYSFGGSFWGLGWLDSKATFPLRCELLPCLSDGDELFALSAIRQRLGDGSALIGELAIFGCCFHWHAPILGA